MHTSFRRRYNSYNDWWTKWWPIGFLNDNTLANEFVGTLLSGDNTCELRFHQDICAVEVRREFKTGMIDGLNFLNKVLKNWKDEELPECDMESLLETFGLKVGRLVTEAGNTHLDIRPPNILLEISSNELKPQNLASLGDYKVKLIDWANCRYDEVSENLEEFEVAIFDFEKSIVATCWDMLFEEMKLVVNCVLTGFIRGVLLAISDLGIPWIQHFGALDKELSNKYFQLVKSAKRKRFNKKLEDEIKKLESKMDFAKKWKEYHEVLKSQAPLKHSIEQLRMASLEWGFYSDDRNPLAKPDEPLKQDVENELNDIKIDFKDIVEQCVLPIRNADGETFTPKIDNAEYQKFMFTHKEFCGSRWVFALCLREGFQVIEYNNCDRVVTVLGRKNFAEEKFTFVLGEVKVMEMDINAFKPPKFQNSPLNLSNCYIPEDSTVGKSLFHMPKENLVEEIETLRKLDENFRAELEGEMNKFKNENLTEFKMKDKRDKDLSEMKNDIEVKNDIIIELRETIENNTTTIETCNNTIQSYKTIIEDCDNTIQSYKTIIEDRDNTIQSYKTIIEDRNNTIKDLKDRKDNKAKPNTIKERDEEIADCKRDIKAKLNTIKERDKEIKDYKKYKMLCIGILLIVLFLFLVHAYFFVTSLNQAENLLKDEDSL